MDIIVCVFVVLVVAVVLLFSIIQIISTTAFTTTSTCEYSTIGLDNDDVIKWKHFLRCWSSVRGIHWWLVDSPHKGQWRRALMFSLMCTRTNGWANNRDVVNLIRQRVYCDVTVITRQWPKQLHDELVPLSDKHPGSCSVYASSCYTEICYNEIKC